jgi:hypothetical protein
MAIKMLPDSDIKLSPISREAQNFGSRTQVKYE